MPDQKNQNKSKSTSAPILAVATITATGGVSEALGLINAKLEKMKNISDTQYCVAHLHQLDDFGDITKQTLVPNLIRAWSSVKSKEAAYNNAAKDLLDTVPVFEISNGTPEQWLKDIKLRLAIINNSEVINKLKAMKDQMSLFMTEEEKRENANKEMMILLESIKD